MSVDRFDLLVARVMMIVVIVCGWTPSCRLSAQETTASPPMVAASQSPGNRSLVPPAEDLVPPAEGNVAPHGIVLGVDIQGNQAVKESRIRAELRTRLDREFDPEVTKADVRRLYKTGLFRNIKTFTRSEPGGVYVVFRVFEQPTVRYVKYIGNRYYKDAKLDKQTGLKVGDAQSRFNVEDGRRRVEQFYRDKGFPKATISILEGAKPGDRGVIYVVNEGPLVRVRRIEFVGNDPDLVRDGRLKSLISTKTPILGYFIRGQLDRSKIDEDTERLTGYYRSLGYFRARIDRELSFDDSGSWATLRFIIDEGQRFRIRSVSILGNERFTSASLTEQLKISAGDYFNLMAMNRDVGTLRDLYGGSGYVYANIKADPRFLEEPGQLDLIYKIEEGAQYRVGQINVHIAGEFPHTRQSVILKRLSLYPGEIIDIREVRSSERRLKSSQLFVNDPSQGRPPAINVRPLEFDVASDDVANNRSQPRRTKSARGQSPSRPSP